ncbi:MAG: polysaccharide deacetylase family protein [Verrucomicrobia bacterium]|nr:polysaccharide deacetylase family protein [Verrucomicrobiota bacterium]
MSRVTILNFHGVGPVTRTISDGERECWLERDHFESVLDLVVGQSHVRLTVDDGNASDLEFIQPAFARRGLRGIFFVCSGLLDQATFLRTASVRELQAQGMTIGCHGAIHQPWRGLNPQQLQVELAASRTALEKICGKSVDQAACPFGSYDRTVLRGLRATGYAKVYTSDGGTANESDWINPRTTITRSMPLAEVQALILRGPGTLRQASISAKRILKEMR